MCLKDILKKLDIDFKTIEYRTIISIDSNDVDTLFGYCRYIGGELMSLDGDNYDFNDEIIKYQIYKDDWLTVWIDGRKDIEKQNT